MTTTKINGALLYHDTVGSGPPLVLLHGGLESSRTWREIVPLLSDAWQVTVIDVRGHGRSTNPAASLTYPEIADDIAALLQALGIRRPAIAGWSDGGQHVLQIGARHPMLARLLIAGAADFDRSPATKDWVRAFFGIDEHGRASLATVEQQLGSGYSHFRAMHDGGDEQWASLVQSTARLWLDYTGLTSEDYQRIPCPTLVMCGDRDDDVPVEDAVGLYRSLRQGELAICPGADHFIPWRRTAWFVATLREFLLRHAAG